MPISANYSVMRSSRHLPNSLLCQADDIFVLELKVNGNAQALAQIKSQNYAESYRGQNKPIHLIGLNFNSESRRVDGVVVERF